MPTTDRKLRVFLCHASQDKPIVGELYQRLLTEGWIDPWLDKEKLLPGQHWELEIEKSVEVADVVIVCLSKSSVEKEGYYQKELKKVLDVADRKPEGTIFIIPLRLEKCKLPYGLDKLHYIDYFFTEEEKAQGYERLFKSLYHRGYVLEQKNLGRFSQALSSDTNVVSSVAFPEIDVIEWKSFGWWIKEIRAGLRGPRGVISIVLAVIGMSCNLCGFPAFCPIHTSFLGLFAAYYAVSQVRKDIYSRKQGAVVGMISATIVAFTQVIAVILSLISVAISFPALSAAADSMYRPSIADFITNVQISVGINLLNLIVTGFLGYYAGYLSITTE